MTGKEKSCWASGGIWMDGKCVRVKPLTMTIPRGTGCEVVEATIRRSLSPADRKARTRAMRKLDRRD